MIRLEIPGIPEGKGSYRAMKRGDRAVLIASGDTSRQARLVTWRKTIVAAVLAQRGSSDAIAFPSGPVFCAAVFRFPLRLGDFADSGLLKSNAPTFVTAKRDADKLARELLDSLTLTKRIWKDDGQAQICAATVYASPGEKLRSTVLLGRDVALIAATWLSELADAEAAIGAAKIRRDQLLRDFSGGMTVLNTKGQP